LQEASQFLLPGFEPINLLLLNPLVTLGDYPALVDRVYSLAVPAGAILAAEVWAVSVMLELALADRVD
jgi:hypothetical protein